MSVERDIVTQFYSALTEGDPESALALLHPSVSWIEAMHSPYWAGEVIGAEAIVDTVFNPINRDFAAFRATPGEIIASGDQVAVFGKYTGVHRSNGKALDATFVHLWTVEDELITRFVQHTDTLAWANTLAASAQVREMRPAFF